MKINLHIDRVVLHDLAIEPHQRELLASALQASLQRQLADAGTQGLPVASRNQGRVSAGAISGGAQTQPVELGRLLGAAIYRGIGT